MYVEVIGWDDLNNEVEFDWLSAYCEDGCSLRNIEEEEIRYIAEYDI